MTFKGTIIVTAIFGLTLTTDLTAQISKGGEPLSYSKQLRLEVMTIRMPFVDVDAFLAEDEIEESKGVPYRFGAPFEVNYNLDNSGNWEELPEGGRLWRLKIVSESAYSINLIYDQFFLPSGGTFFIYNEDRSMIIGAFTERNNKDHGQFATALVKGDVSILEYYEPESVRGKGIISIKRVVHAYRNLFNWDIAKQLFGYGDAGACNNNVACPVGDDWRDDIRSSAMITTSGGFRLCSGSLVNNVREDLTPYFLTANHCLGGEPTWIFMFNYESPSCTNVDGPTWMTVSGSTLRASASFSDFALLELSEQPPDSYSVYYSGWSAIDTAADSCVAIHHPSGDIKKISFNSDPVTSTSYLGTSPGNGSHWRVDDWEDGTTEPGSSGSPIFDYDHRIIGQLHGGYASCASITADWYGKVSISWANGGTASSRLKDWLDPDNTGTLELNGRDGAGIQITHTPLQDTRDSLNDYQVLAVIKSNVALTADSLLLYYEISSVWYEDTLTSTGTPDEFEGFIPAQSPGTSINYYLFASDAEGKADTTDTFSFRVIDYGATLVPSYSEKTVAANDTAWHTFEVTNAGIYDDSFDLSVSGNIWATSIWDETGTTPISSTGLMASDDTVVFKVRVEVPTSFFGDYDSAKVGVTSTGDPTISLGAGVKTISAGEPLTIPFSDNFPTTTIDNGKWIIIEDANSNSGGLNPPSAPYSLNLNGSPDGGDLVSSQAINLKNETNVIFSYYYEQTGSGDSPETNDDLLVEYLDSLGSWNTVSLHAGADPDMTDFVQIETTLPGDAYHSNFRIRFSNSATAGFFDDWFIDNIYVGLPQDYEVAISPSFASINGPSGDTTSYLLTVKNIGIFDDNYDLSDSNAVWAVSFFDGTGTTPVSSTGSIIAGDSVEIIVKVAIPSGAAINDADTAEVYAVSQTNPSVYGTAVLVTISAGTPVSYPWFEPFPDPTLSTVRWFYNAGADVSVDGAAPPSSPYSLNLDGGIDTVVSQLIDLSSKSGVLLSYYYQRGGGGEPPDAGDDLWVEYVNDVGSWITLSTQLGSGPTTATFEQVTLGLPVDAFHSGFQFRIRSAGSCVDCDDWFVDDIRIDFAPAIGVSPASFSVTLPQEDSTTRSLIVSNAGPGGLNYNVSIQPQVKESELFNRLLADGQTEPARRTYPEGFFDYDDPKGVDDPRTGFPIDKNAGGPDAFGYFWIDSDEPGGPEFSWIDVSATGTDIVADLTDDNFGGPYSIGMDFSYYGNTYNQIYIGSNGIIGFGATDMSSRFKVSIPTASTPNNMIAWLWDDLNPVDATNPGAHVYVDSDGSRCVIQFVDYPEYAASAGDIVTAEVILYADGTIVMQYQSIAAGFDIASCAIGIENSDGADGLEVAFQTPYLHDNLAIQFFAPQQWLAIDQSAGALAAGEADTLICSIVSSGLDMGTYYSNIVVSSNDPDSIENPWIVPVQLTVSDSPAFICGDVDGDSDGPNVADLTYLVGFLFLGGPPPPVPAAADMDAGGDINVADLTALVDFLFLGGDPLVCP